ncbi:MAG: hydantoinase/oxoprolinase family protein [Thermoflavifilum sp.]|nr:hydantoinase/oxoprolinase family protein [Thermoflavifilum sp.]MCL6514703.1 hydantoinase/oxoprolinase family protein [Alicyclobacillus sp.]
MAWIAGVDVGGTFTDLIAFNTDTGEVRVVKTPSTPGDQSEGFVNALTLSGIDISEIRWIIHGTTVATNAILERKGARVGLITTKGFRDVLEMRRRERAQTWGLWGDYIPLVPRKWRCEVTERVLADGTVRQPLSENEVEEVARYLVAQGCDAVAVALIHSYANPQHEQQVAEILRKVWPNEYISISSEILPEIREFERTSTTVVNAYVQPKIDLYLDRLSHRLADHGFQHDIQIIQSNGGIMSSSQARRRAVNTVLSGPAAGVIAAAQVGLASGFDHVISADMGGTSFDVSLIVNGQPAMQSQQTIEFGVVIRVPMIEITTIGAGGGSIAWIDKSGMLRIGPESAGSYPGPVAFGRGGTRPTVTDANVVLGRINPNQPIGSKGKTLDVEGAKQAIERDIARPLGMDVYSAAEAILKVAVSRMAGALRLVSVERGHDPRRFALVPFGGAGPLHAAALIRECRIGTAVIPYYPGITSALGCITANVQYDFLRTINRSLADLDIQETRSILEHFTIEGRHKLEESNLPLVGVSVRYEADMAYEGQTHTVQVTLPIENLTLESIKDAFEAAYLREFGQLLRGIPIRVQTLRASVIGLRPAFNLAQMAQQHWPKITGHDNEFLAVPVAKRPVYFHGEFIQTPVYRREQLLPGTTIKGPAIVEQEDTTIVVEPDMQATVDTCGHLLVSLLDMLGTEGVGDSNAAVGRGAIH